MALDQDIADWDGKTASVIATVYDNHRQGSGFVDQLLTLLAHGGMEKGASWLIKHHLETDAVLETAEVMRLCDAMAGVQHWESRLHFLQALQYLAIPSGRAEDVAVFLRESLKSPRPFVRAWAVNGFHILAAQYPVYETEQVAIFEAALKDEAASVKARIRNILRTGTKGKGK